MLDTKDRLRLVIGAIIGLTIIINSKLTKRIGFWTDKDATWQISQAEFKTDGRTPRQRTRCYLAWKEANFCWNA